MKAPFQKDQPGNRAQVVLVVKNRPANAGDSTDKGLTSRSGRSPGVVNGNPLQYSCLENFMDREWWAPVHGVANSLSSPKLTLLQRLLIFHGILC